MLQGVFFKLALLVLLSSLQYGQPQEEQPTADEGTNAGVAAVFDEIKTLLNIVKSKNNLQIREFRSFRDQVEGSLVSLRAELSSLNDSVSNLSMCLQEHKQQTAAELAQLQSSLNTTQSSLTATQSSLTQQVNAKLNTLTAKLDLLTATTAQLSTDHQQIQTSISDVECVDTEESSQLHQNLQNNLTHQLENIQSYVTGLYGTYTCGGTGGWRRVVYLDMTDSSTTCPTGWQLTGYSKRTCGRRSSGTSCDSVTFPVKGSEYSRVCGRIKAYQYSYTDAFEAYHDGTATTIDSAYVTGISLTHGSPRQHIWTFAAGASEQEPLSHADDACPCDTTSHIDIPSFMDDSYFCESGVNVGTASTALYFDDPLWDGQKCGLNSTCCSFNNPPYFVKYLPTSTTDNVEARLCALESGEDVPIELIELYVQ